MTTNGTAKTLTLGDMVEQLIGRADTTAGEGAAAADLAARRLEQVLVRGGNLRLATALADLASELAPASSISRCRAVALSFPAARAA